ncbi:MAG: hypothetical protein OEY56_13680 [Cyclobacteriaceae bacterium]|nr:hypothetical protein [Cyclobacteriaceae bacterium]
MKTILKRLLIYFVNSRLLYFDMEKNEAIYDFSTMGIDDVDLQPVLEMVANSKMWKVHESICLEEQSISSMKLRLFTVHFTYVKKRYLLLLCTENNGIAHGKVLVKLKETIKLLEDANA